MSKRSGGKNRVCLACQIKYPGQFTTDPTKANVTQVCSECAGPLTLIPDSVRVPKKTDRKGWAKLTAEVAAGNISRPLHPYREKRRFYAEHPEHEKLDRKLEDKARRTELREELQQLQAAYPNLCEQVLVRYERIEDFDFSFENIAHDLCQVRNDLPKEKEKAKILVCRAYSLSRIVKPVSVSSKV